MLTAFLFAAQGFAYMVVVDPFTDERTYWAQSGLNEGPYLGVACGAETEGELAVIVDTGRPMFSPPIPLVAKYPERVRFDAEPMNEFGFRYNGDYAVLNGRDARSFIDAMKRASTVVVEVEDYRGRKVQLTMSLDGAADSVARVEANCPR